ncbi:hypothetical protein OGAPHI_005882 [Ogataea philodendri]|uniref:CTLH domain-containing protein n=1 Tax=Ogataea philodendri TaxID=1378263 RepID=A0A9P8T261_9ASCO|nr:uncharacterized protein OGAPHI_005882 [Ogataea philodendri]KAH3662630.1 hypothetical protein OGAPHI_005882 [Ogataea philodendri]
MKPDTYLRLIESERTGQVLLAGDNIEARIADKDKLELKRKIDYLVLEYLTHEGYGDTAVELAKEMELDLSRGQLGGKTEFSEETDLQSVETLFSAESIKSNLENGSGVASPALETCTQLESAHTRHQIKVHILAGRVEEAVALVNQEYPSLFEQNQIAYFRLLHLQLIEIIRAQFSGPSDGVQDEREFLDRVLEFISSKLSTLKILQNKKFIQELELTMALLCFGSRLRDPKLEGIPAELKRLLDVKMRGRVADLVNRSILLSLSNSDLTPTRDFTGWCTWRVGVPKPALDPDAAETGPDDLPQTKSAGLYELLAMVTWLAQANGDSVDTQLGALLK